MTQQRINNRRIGLPRLLSDTFRGQQQQLQYFKCIPSTGSKRPNCNQMKTVVVPFVTRAAADSEVLNHHRSKLRPIRSITLLILMQLLLFIPPQQAFRMPTTTQWSFSSRAAAQWQQISYSAQANLNCHCKSIQRIPRSHRIVSPLHSSTAAQFDTSTSSASTNTTAAYNNYSPEILQQIKQHVSIIDVIQDTAHPPKFTVHHNSNGQYRRATALCPFHDDTNPSLSIDESRHMYKCFACGAGGDMFAFLMQYGKQQQKGPEEKTMSFGQAVEHVLQQYCEPEFVHSLGLVSTSSGRVRKREVSPEDAMVKAKKERYVRRE